MGCFGVSVWEIIIAKNNASFNPLRWLLCFMQGVVWIIFTLSLLVQGSENYKIFTSAWWVVFFLSNSALNIEVLIRTHHIEILAVVTWIPAFLLLCGALMNFHCIVSQLAARSRRSKTTLSSEPLLVEQSDGNETNVISHASFFSKLWFSWMDPLLMLGKSKTLVLEDIPCLGVEDKAEQSYEKWSWEWDVIKRERQSNNSGTLILGAMARIYWKQMVIMGVATIRAFGMEDRFFHNYLKLVDADARVFFCSNGAMEWLVLRTEALQNLTLFVGAFLLILVPTGFLSSGLVGLSLSYAFVLTATQVFLSRWYSSLANYIISAERMKQYMHIPPEPPAIVECSRPPSTLPAKGRIDFMNLKIRYCPNAPMVLKGITCTLREGDRVGVVGRTGSGKTTLISALFRLIGPYSGQIIIDVWSLLFNLNKFSP